jgi:hypothetical protein
MEHQVLITGAGLRPPRAAAAAGILFSLLLGLALILITVSAPSDPAAAGARVIVGASSSRGDAGGSRWHFWPPPVYASRQDQIRSPRGVM